MPMAGSLRDGLARTALAALTLASTSCAQIETALLQLPGQPVATDGVSGPMSPIGPDAPHRVKVCSFYCVVQNGVNTQGTSCHPYVHPSQADTLPPAPAIPAGPRCPTYSPTMYIQPTSPYCWISDDRYCKYSVAGRTGYSCSCGGRSGYFD